MNAEVKRKRFVTTAEMPKLVEQIQLVPNVFHRVALWTYILTGRRKNEVLRLRWLDYNRKEQLVTWRIKGGRTETTPISGFNAQLIEALPRYSGNPYVFVGKIAKRPIADLRYWWDEVREKAGLEDVRIHDLRHTLVSWVSATGKTSALIASIVGHQDERTTQRYLHFEDAPLKQALDDHATRVRKLVDAEAQKREAAKAASTEVIDVQASEP
jgi:integrase